MGIETLLGPSQTSKMEIFYELNIAPFHEGITTYFFEFLIIQI